MIMRKTILLALLFLSIQSYAQIEHLIVLDISDLGGEKKSIYSSIDACNDLVDNLDYQRNNYLVYVCNAQSPIIISNDDDFDKEIEEVYQLDPDIPNPLNTIESIIESLGDKELSNGFKIHYFSSLANLCSHTKNHKDLLLGGLLTILDEEIEGQDNLLPELYLSTTDRDLNKSYFQEISRSRNYNTNLY